MESATSAGTATSTARTLADAPSTGGEFYRPIAPWMEKVELRLRKEMRSRHEELEPILRHGVMLGGKRLRPALVLLAGAAVGPLDESHVTIATVLEMVHTATLVHDDVLDKAETRRHVPTVNALWDNSASILLGDFLFSHGFYLAATTGSTNCCRAIGTASRRVCEGELRQVISAGDVLLTEETYLQLIEGKTAELTRVACELGADLAGGNAQQIEAVGRFGRSLGIAFQIADDYLDIWGRAEVVGKTLGSDLAQGKATLPLIRALHAGPSRVRAELLAACRADVPPSRGELLSMLEATDARQYTMDRARAIVEEAHDALACLPPSDSRESLRRIAEFAIDRKC